MATMNRFISMLGIILLGLSSCGGGQVPAAQKSSMTLFVPLYAWPNLTTPNNDWQRVAKAASLLPVIAVINPNSGPLSPAPQAFLDGIALLHQAGAKVLGYIPSGFGARSLLAMQQDMDKYTAYKVDGFFFDTVEVSGGIARYKTLCNYKPNQFTVLNPGTSFPNAYISNGCSMGVVFENTEALWATHTLTAENALLSSTQKVALIHTASVNIASLQSSLNHAASLGIGSVMVTDQGTASMWIKQPSYLQEESQILSGMPLP